jgi:CBS domain-containing protein
MQVRDLMSEDPICCSPEDRVRDVAGLMAKHDCGEIPVLDVGGKPIGVLTDRDIVCRVIARSRAIDTPVREVMSTPAVTVTPDTMIDLCCRIMEVNQVRRLPVVDDDGCCCGMVAQADIALHASDEMAADVVRDVSRPSAAASRVEKG